MARLLYSATMSLDGFIAGPDGDMSWLSAFSGPDPAVDALVDEIGALLVGNRTYRGDDPNRGTDNEGAFGGAWCGPQFVLTHHIPETPVPGTTFLDDLDTAIAAAKQAAGGKYVNVLGADVAAQCLTAGHLDEILVYIAPVLLGAGTRLFLHDGGTNISLERLSTNESLAATSIWYRVPR
ncbi:dihydrofolate reductase family protein [Actinokineospora terrae]|uniref:Dihydrofolate reductase n=1 Tax=Actinokineospora terrae TaxID=155974 RepID=A0A1H9TAX4_9PSEU|nr:dihydrofolate reductase family protein [Actinokineospora terrae]SER94372.1 Dihydrofolate reductase [Actinokineospora terrae]